MSENESIEKKIYQVTNRSTGERRTVASSAAQNACAGCGWMIADCHVEELKTYRHPRRTSDPGVYVKLPCNVCSFQYAQCVKPEDDACPCHPETPDLGEWLKQVTNAHLCSFIGGDLTRPDYLLHQKWLTMEEAVKELTPK